jgi:hypothetical protein
MTTLPRGVAWCGVAYHNAPHRIDERDTTTKHTHSRYRNNQSLLLLLLFTTTYGGSSPNPSFRSKFLIHDSQTVLQ